MANFSSDLTLYSGVKIDNTYENVLTSTSYLVDDDVTSVNVYTSQSNPSYYIRLDKNKVRITHSNMRVSNGGSTINLYRCNYLRFNNTAYEKKSFYCFVTAVRYINDETAELDFEVDVFTTWVATGSAQFEECFIERKHTDDDIIGKYILEEPVDVGEYIYSTPLPVNPYLRMCIGVGGWYDTNINRWTENGADIYTMNNLCVMDGVSRFVFDSDGNTIDMFNNNPFTNVTQFVNSLVGDGGQLSWIKFAYYFPWNNGSTSINRTFETGGVGDNFSYKPKNNKLWCYPYYGCMVNNHEGSCCDYAFELSETNGTLYFDIDSSILDGSMSVTVKNYKGGYRNSVVTKNKYPVLSSASQEYATYMANLKAQFATDLSTNVVAPAISGALIGSSAFGIGGVAGAVIGGGMGLLNYILKSYSGGEQAKLKGATPCGVNSGMLQQANNTTPIHIYVKSIRTEYAKAIDNFFTRFGYKVNALEIPKMTNNRFDYHYIKTIGCAVKGHIPSTAQAKIQQVMDNGVTFWNTSDVGNYS